MPRFLRCPLAAVLVVIAAAGCSKPSEGEDDQAKPKRRSSSTTATATEEDSKRALVEEHDFGTIAWTFEADGVVKADVRDPSGAPIKEGFSGELKVGPAAKPTTVALKPVEGAALYGASLPAFSAELTPVTYVVKVKEKPYGGTLHVPAGGTAIMFASAPSVTVAVDAKGPHGGVIQVVGEDRVELVSDESTGEVRAFVLDADLKPMPIGERTITLGVVADVPETIVLAPSPDRAYFAAHWRLRADPSRVTICVHAGPVVRVAIVGWHPGVRLVVGARAPVWHVRVHAGWGPPAVWLHDEDWDDEGEVRLHLGGPGRGHGHGRGHGWRKHH